MGIFDLFSKEGRAKSALDRHVKKVNDKWAQSADRFAAMEGLREIGTEAAIDGLLRRFGYVYDKTIEDEQEKEWVESNLVALGERALPSVRKYILSGETISYPLRVLGQIAKPDKVLAIVDELCAREEPGYTRHPQKKIQMLSWLGEWSGADRVDVGRRIIPYLKDFDENVRFAAIDGLAHLKPDESEARGPLIDALVRPEEESRRIKVRLAEVLAEAGFTIDDTPEHKEAVTKLVAGSLPEFTISQDKLTKKGK